MPSVCTMAVTQSSGGLPSMSTSDRSSRRLVTRRKRDRSQGQRCDSAWTLECRGSRIGCNIRQMVSDSPAEGPVMQDVIDIEVTLLSAACGAEIKGIDLTRPLSAATIQAVKEAWDRHLVLVFRGQTLSRDDQLRFASYFGELGDRKKAPEQLRNRVEGSQQDNQKILLVSNIKAEGKAIGAFGEGEFWFHIDGGYTPRAYR